MKWNKWTIGGSIVIAWYIISQPVKASASADKLGAFLSHAGDSVSTFLGGLG